jgi:hypothetical protein
MANWHLSYGLHGKRPGEKRLRTKLVMNNGGLQLTMGGGIPEGIVPMVEVFELVEKHLVGLDDLDSELPESHVKTLQGIANYCNELAEKISK